MKDLIVRAQTPAEATAVHKVVAAAFNRDSEANLVTLIESRDQVLISLVACLADEVIGHVLVSPITLEIPGKFGGVAPLSVLPRYQGKGVGGQLMHEMMAQCRELALDALFLLGNPRYYQRFGFEVSHVANEYGATDAFQHYELVAGVLADAHGPAQYVKAFAEEAV